MFRNLIRIVTGERSTVIPHEQPATEAKEQKAVKIRFASDFKALKEAGYRIAEGEEIVMDLKTALTIMPRDRKRVDAYKSLTDYLNKEFGCRLVITSQKTRKEAEA